jgi:hypothetical protein
MRNTPWSKLEHVGDQSTYVSELLRHINAKASEVLALLSKQQYARAFCDNLVESVATTFLSSIFAARSISEPAAEQMLLDSYVLKKGLESLPTLNADPGTAPPPRYASLSSSFLSFLPRSISFRTDPPGALRGPLRGASFLFPVISLSSHRSLLRASGPPNPH